jgi:hypothetical protein
MTTAHAVSERPIIFSGEMVRAILAGKKTQTRRVIKPSWSRCLDLDDPDDRDKALAACPYGQIGDRLWVRETFVLEHCEMPQEANADRPVLMEYIEGEGNVWYVPHYRATDPEPHIVPEDAEDLDDRTRWTSPIHMPRWASRILLEITDRRIQRLQEIGPADLRAEGFAERNGDDYRANRVRFREAWDKFNGKRGFEWAANPHNFAITFKRIVP